MTDFQENVYRAKLLIQQGLPKPKNIIIFLASRRLEVCIWWTWKVNLKIWPQVKVKNPGSKILTWGQIFTLTFQGHQIQISKRLAPRNMMVFRNFIFVFGIRFFVSFSFWLSLLDEKLSAMNSFLKTVLLFYIPPDLIAYYIHLKSRTPLLKLSMGFPTLFSDLLELL